MVWCDVIAALWSGREMDWRAPRGKSVCVTPCQRRKYARLLYLGVVSCDQIVVAILTSSSPSSSTPWSAVNFIFNFVTVLTLIVTFCRLLHFRATQSSKLLNPEHLQCRFLLVALSRGIVKLCHYVSACIYVCQLYRQELSGMDALPPVVLDRGAQAVSLVKLGKASKTKSNIMVLAFQGYAS